MDNKGGYDEGLEGVEPERAKPMQHGMAE